MSLRLIVCNPRCKRVDVLFQRYIEAREKVVCLLIKKKQIYLKPQVSIQNSVIVGEIQSICALPYMVYIPFKLYEYTYREEHYLRLTS